MSRDTQKPTVSDQSAFYDTCFAALSKAGVRFLVAGSTAENYLVNDSHHRLQKLEVWVDPKLTKADEGKVWAHVRDELEARGGFDADTRYALFNTVVFHRNPELQLAFDSAYSASIPARFMNRSVKVIRGEDLVAMKLASPHLSTVEEGRRLQKVFEEVGKPKVDLEVDLHTTLTPRFELH